LNDTPLVFKALQFAARRHTHHRRKGGKDIPYINHPIDVATLLATVGGVTDPEILAAALLHDTVEDTDATHEDIVREFGEVVAGLVAEVTDDPDVSSAERKRRQEAEAPFKSPRAKMIRLADKACNVHDITHTPPESWSLERRREYFAWAARVVDALGMVHPALEAEFAQRIERARLL
jgi:GTP diphosphokinase / guanosine-3',5'-bis(diphosphate) 3'-diphosphatase